MRTAIYAGLFALALLLAVALLTTKLPAPAPTLVPTPSPSPGTTLNPAMPAVTVAFPNATSSAEFHLPPLSYTSPTGFTITLADVAYGPDCLRIQALASGLPPATGVDTQDPPTSVFSELNLIDPATSGPLLATLVGGGGGGGQAPDGSPLLNQEAVYAFTPNLPLDGLVLLVVELVPDASLGFEAPLTFNLQATRSTTDNCGLQGSIGP